MTAASGGVATTGALAPILTTLSSLKRLCLVHDRPELAEAAQDALDRSSSTALRIVVMGEYKTGKSSLVNALVQAPICSVQDDTSAAAPVEVGYSDTPGARQWLQSPKGDSDNNQPYSIALTPERVAEASTDPSTTLIRVGLPRQLLRSGLVLVDTPGVGGIGSAAAVVTASSLADVHAVLFVSDASQELTRVEAEAISDAARRCSQVVFVETKIDLYPQWRKIVEADHKHLSELDLDIPIVCVSTSLRTLALQSDDAELNAESGFAELVRLVNDRFVVSGEQAILEGAMQTARRVYAHLREPLVVELKLLSDDDHAVADRDVADARDRLEAFRERATGWQQKLTDACTDLAAAVDVDLRGGFRVLLAQAEEQLDDSDPDAIWDEFEPAVYRRTAEALDGNLTLLRERAEHVAQQLASAIDDDEGRLFMDDRITAACSPSPSLAQRSQDAAAPSGARAQQAMRAGYGSAMPILMVGGLALGVLGLGTLVLPLAAAVGVMGGRKALTDDRERNLAKRRQQAKIAVKKYLDEALFLAAADRKQEQRNVQRLLRDHFRDRVKELGATRQDALGRAEAASKADRTQSRLRRESVHEDLVRIEDIARTMATGTTVDD